MATNQKVGGSSPSWRASGKLPLPSRDHHICGDRDFCCPRFNFVQYSQGLHPTQDAVLVPCGDRSAPTEPAGETFTSVRFAFFVPAFFAGLVRGATSADVHLRLSLCGRQPATHGVTCRGATLADAHLRLPLCGRQPATRGATCQGCNPADVHLRLPLCGRQPATHGATCPGCNPADVYLRLPLCGRQAATHGATCPGCNPRGLLEVQPPLTFHAPYDRIILLN